MKNFDSQKTQSKKPSRSLSLLAISAFAFVTGCASVHDLAPGVPVTDRAVLKGGAGGSGIRLLSIDGTRGPKTFLGFGSKWDAAYVVYLVPGKHRLGLWNYLSSNGYCSKRSPGQKFESMHYLEFIAEPGHTYRVVGKTNRPYHWDATIKDSLGDQKEKDTPYVLECPALVDLP